jgi:hypothetical protein
MVIEQMVDIPANHRIFLDVPPDIPQGKARVELKVTPVYEEQDGAEAEAAKSATPITDRLAGIAAHLDDITLEQIREERLSKKAEGLAAKSATPHADFLSGILASAGDITMKQIREERLVKKYPHGAAMTPLLAMRGIDRDKDTLDAYFERKRADKAREDSQIERQLRSSGQFRREHP